MYPKVRVELNKELDKWVCDNFINHKKAGVDFGGRIIQLHPNLKTVRDNPLTQMILEINQYVDSYYEKNGPEIKKRIISAQTEWNKVGKLFFSTCDTFFNRQPWPKGEYAAYLSIFDCNPRFLENKTFQVFWKHPKGFVKVAAHEMLHFLFYSYVEKNYPDIKLSDDKLWSFSEIINHFLLQKPEFVRITGDMSTGLYPQLEEEAKSLWSKWQKSKNAIDFIQKGLRG